MVKKMNDTEKTREFIRKRYGEIAEGQGGCGCAPGCCCGSAPADTAKAAEALGYTKDDLDGVAKHANLGLGCGNPVALAALREGETVVDLGSGGGFDCFLTAERVGETGRVIGVDMTPEMVSLARANAVKGGYANVEFRLGEIEHLPVADASADAVISNCVINLAADKQQVFFEAFRVLRPGGRLSVSDVVATAELPEDIKKDPAMTAGCVAGAVYAEDIRRMLEKAGFTGIRMAPKDNSREILSSWAFGDRVEDYVAAYLIEAVKPDAGCCGCGCEGC